MESPPLFQSQIRLDVLHLDFFTSDTAAFLSVCKTVDELQGSFVFFLFILTDLRLKQKLLI